MSLLIFQSLFHLLKKEFDQLSPESEEIIISFLNIFFLRLRNRFMELLQNENPVVSLSGNLVFSFSQLVDRHFDEIHQVKEYAELLGESPVVLNREVKSLTGKTPSELIVERFDFRSQTLASVFRP